ncbi:MAG: ATP-binding cassette domain-containing protein, partial [Christensenellaceae bacterium]|nr:ATP-binding cassette domain-containing protein [Christensenellaceae bacterium]
MLYLKRIVMLRAERLIKKYDDGTEEVLSSVSFTLPDTGLVFILGKSGSGKSTLVNILAGLDSPNSGAVYLNGSEIGKELTREEYRRNCVSFVFQEICLNKSLNAVENVNSSLRIINESDLSAAKNALKDVGLAGKERRKSRALSGGEAQRTAVARALIKKPEVVFADEPTGQLDENNGRAIFKELQFAAQNTLIVVITHDRASAEEFADRIIEIEDGKIVSDKVRNPRGVAPVTLDNGKKEIIIENGCVLTQEDLDILNSHPEYTLIVSENAAFINYESPKFTAPLRLSASALASEYGYTLAEGVIAGANARACNKAAEKSGERLSTKNAIYFAGRNFLSSWVRVTAAILIISLIASIAGLGICVIAYDKYGAQAQAFKDKHETEAVLYQGESDGNVTIKSAKTFPTAVAANLKSDSSNFSVQRLYSAYGFVIPSVDALGESTTSAVVENTPFSSFISADTPFAATGVYETTYADMQAHFGYPFKNEKYRGVSNPFVILFDTYYEKALDSARALYDGGGILAPAENEDLPDLIVRFLQHPVSDGFFTTEQKEALSNDFVRRAVYAKIQERIEYDGKPWRTSFDILFNELIATDFSDLAKFASSSLAPSAKETELIHSIFKDHGTLEEIFSDRRERLTAVTFRSYFPQSGAPQTPAALGEQFPNSAAVGLYYAANGGDVTMLDASGFPYVLNGDGTPIIDLRADGMPETEIGRALPAVVVTDFMVFAATKLLSDYIETHETGIEFALPKTRNELKEFLNSGFEGALAATFNILNERYPIADFRIAGIVETGYAEKYLDVLLGGGTAKEQLDFAYNVENYYLALFAATDFHKFCYTNNVITDGEHYTSVSSEQLASYLSESPDTVKYAAGINYTYVTDALADKEAVVTQLYYLRKFGTEFDPLLPPQTTADGIRVVAVIVSPNNYFDEKDGIIFSDGYFARFAQSVNYFAGLAVQFNSDSSIDRLFELVKNNNLYYRSSYSPLLNDAAEVIDTMREIFTPLLFVLMFALIVATATFVAASVVRNKREIGVERALGLNKSGVIRVHSFVPFVIAVGAMLASAAFTFMNLEVTNTILHNTIPGLKSAAFENIEIIYFTALPFIIEG